MKEEGGKGQPSPPLSADGRLPARPAFSGLGAATSHSTRQASHRHPGTIPCVPKFLNLAVILRPENCHSGELRECIRFKSDPHFIENCRVFGIFS